MFAKFTSALLLALPLLASAAPAVAPRASGQATYYHPGLGACGQTHGDGDLVVAMSAPLFDAQKPCGRSIKVKGAAGEGCAYNDIDLSPTAFQKAIGDLGIGRTTTTWDWA
ncbi:hypothetical protein LCI18_004364 [Fusarium solani-melongenae]|uniref:Uncharacterized protein n=1 Tax=Fusarium solani subsp. cucurbitae TaxID=2747967 RepID=A0ACD3YWS7_FUSSC|nr:hypothetical protein LCI18_004364 [Fusarium solani-melongenae]